MPSTAFAAMEDTITEIIHRHNSKLLSIGLSWHFIFSTSGVNAMMGAFNKSIHVKEQRPAWKHQVIAIALVIVLTIAIFVAVTILIGAQFLVDKNCPP